MTDNQGRHRQLPSAISVGDIHDSAGVAIGHGAYASVTAHALPAQRDAAVLLDEFMGQLAQHRDRVADAADIRESAETVRAELAAPSPRWHVVRGLLRGIAAGVAGVSALAEAVDKIQALVAHLGI